jgi:putative transposase
MIRMPRPLRIQFPNAWYHIMNRGAGKKQIFRSEEQRVYFVELLAESVQQFKIQIHAFCLMDNHFHLLINTPEPSLSEAMKFISASYARKFNRDGRTDGSLCRGRFKSIVLDADDYLVQVSRYIHRNPVEAGLVRRPELYAWSSYAGYKNSIKKPSWLTTDAVLEKSGSMFPGQVEGYLRFVENGSYPSMKAFYNSKRIPGVLGSKAFRHYIAGFGFTELASNNRVLPLELVEQAVVSLHGCAVSHIRQSSRGSKNGARMTAMHIASKWCGLPQVRLAAHFSSKPSSFLVKLSQLRRRIRNDASFAAQVEAVERSLGVLKK